MASSMSKYQDLGQVGGSIRYNQGVLIQGNNISTGRDVNINVTASLARSLYKSITSFESFQLLANDISSIATALSDVKGSLNRVRTDQAPVREFVAIMTSCEAALESTQGLLLEYTSLSSTERETWERSEHTLDQVATLKENLAQSVRRLTLFNTTQNSVTTNKINDALQMVLQQIRAQSQHHAIPHMQDQQSMNDEAHLAISEIVTSLSSEQTLCDQNEDPDVKEGSILTMYTADTMTVDAKENWRQLRKALQGMGVSDQVFKQRQGYITSKLRELIVEVEPEQEGDADFSRPQLDHVPEQTKLTEDSDVFTSGSSIRTFYTCTEEAEQFAPDLPPKPMTRSIESQPTLSDKILKSLGYYRQDNALLAAIKAGDIVQLETCLRRGANINGGKKPSKRLGVPLVLATYLGNQGIVRLLLDRGADIEAVDDYSGNSSLMWAASKGQVGMVQLLLNRSANIEAKTRFGGTAIMGAAYWNNKDVVQLLLERGADIEAKNKEDRTSLLEASTSAFSSKEMVLLLLERGAKIDAKDKYDCTSLMVAAWKGHMGIVLLLRDWGADIEPKNIFGQAAHMMAAWNGHKYVVQVLLGWGADIEVKDKYGRTALLMATGEGHKSAVQLLLEWGADIEAKDESSWTALTMAASQGHKSVVQLLLDRGANFSTKDNKGRTPRDYVIEESLKLNGMVT